MPDPIGDAAPAVMRQFLIFEVGTRHYAIPAAGVAEVVHVPDVTRVPQSPAALLGLANLRGSVVPVVSVRSLLGMAEFSGKSASDAARAIVTRAISPVALMVDAVDALEAVNEAEIDARQSDLSAQDGERLTGAYKSTALDEIIKVLDIEALLEATFAQRSRLRIDRPAIMTATAAVGAAEPSTGPGRTLVTFEVADQEFAFDLAVVREVIPVAPSATMYPHAQAAVLGVTALRNALLPLMSLRALLGFPPAGWTDQQKAVVVQLGGAWVGLVADSARTVLSADERSIDAVPWVLAARQKGESRIRAIYRGDAGARLISILEPDHLFQEDVMQRLRALPRDALTDASEQSSESVSFISILVFRLGDDEFGLPIEAVDEVAHMPSRVTRVPKTPKFLEGVINLRGEVVPVVDLRRRFEMSAATDLAARRLVVVRSEKHRAALIVDSVTGVLQVPKRSVDDSPPLTDEVTDLIYGVVNLQEQQRMVLMLDPDELLTRAERDLLDPFRVAADSDTCVIKVLVVDDSALVRKLFGAALESESDMQVQFARNGLEALGLLETFKPDVITLDIQMPGMNGLECLDRIMVLRPSPVLMVSTLTADGADHTLRALELGAVDFVPKPGGAVSLRMAEFAPTLVAKIRAAAAVRVRKSTRLVERLKSRSAVSGAVVAAARPRRGAVAKDASAQTGSSSSERLVLVGASTGGPPALETLLTRLPANFAWPIVVAQHMPASFTGPLAARLNGLAQIRVVELRTPTVLEPGFAYIGRGDADVVIARQQGGLMAMTVPANPGYPWHPSTDRLVRSAMEHLEPGQIVGVLMTGMGNDGAMAMAQLYEQGGQTIAESEDTAVIWGMPGALVNAGGATFVEPLSAIPVRLQQVVNACL